MFLLKRGGAKENDFGSEVREGKRKRRKNQRNQNAFKPKKEKMQFGKKEPGD